MTPIRDEYDRAPCGLLTISRTGRIIASNGTFRAMVGASRLSDASGFLDLLRAGDRIYWETHVGPLLDMSGHVNEIAVELSTETDTLPVLMNARISRPGDLDSRIDLALFPATDRRSYERELLAARKRAETSEERARRLAETLQQSLLPPALPSIPGLDIGAAYRPARHEVGVGGDFYDFFRVNPSEWVVALGDPCGKGAAAAAVTSLVRYTIRGAAMETDDLPEVVNAVNTTLLADPTPETCTALIARLTPLDGAHRVLIVSAGHPLPQLVRPSGEVRTVGEHGPLLGAFAETDHRAVREVLHQGDALVMFTDGVTEARRGDEFLGEERVQQLLADGCNLDAQTLATTLADRVLEFGDEPTYDDIAIVVLRGLGP